jgi:hypothetical protein
MHELYKLKEMLCEELKEYGNKEEMSAGALEVVDKLAHAVKNLDKIIEAYENDEGYSGNYPDGMNYRGGSSRNNARTYRNGTSYARNRRRDSMGRYSSTGYSRADAREDMIEQLRDMMQSAPDERMRQRIEQLMREFEQQ